MSPAQHRTVRFNAQSDQFVTLFGRQGAIRVFVQQLLVTLHVRFCLAAAGDAPQYLVVQAVQRGQVGLEFGWRIVPSGWTADLYSVEQHVIQ